MGVYGSLILRLLLFIRGDGVHKAVAVLRLCKLLLRILYRVLGRLDLRRRRAGAFLLQIRQRFLFIRQILGQSAMTVLPLSSLTSLPSLSFLGCSLP